MSITFKRVIDVVSWSALAVLTIFTLALILSAFNMGVRAFVVSSGSMSPALDTGDLVFVRGSDFYEAGDIITFIGANDKYISIRVYLVENRDGETIYTTKGDAIDDPDGSPVRAHRCAALTYIEWSLARVPIGVSRSIRCHLKSRGACQPSSPALLVTT